MTKIIVLTGPESTAKSTLCAHLAEKFGGLSFPEYARTYLEGKPEHYTYDDVAAIAKGQLEQYKSGLQSGRSYVFLDTWLIVTKIWFQWVYGKQPGWLEGAMRDYPVQLYLLCKPDIPWEPDPLRENGGEQREKLYRIYKDELESMQLPYVEIEGEGEQRLRNAIEAIDNFKF